MGSSGAVMEHLCVNMPLEMHESVEDSDSSEKDESILKRRTVTVLDWDDTLLASSDIFAMDAYVNEAGLKGPTDEFVEQLRVLEDHVLGLLTESMRVGDVIVITNAEAGWVEMSGRQFMPNVSSFLKKRNIPVVSARSSYEHAFPKQPIMWKAYAFWNELVRMYEEPRDLNVVVIGDGVGERVAAKVLIEYLRNSVVKTMCLVASPTVGQLTEELSLVTSYLSDVVDASRSFEICI